MHAAEDNDDVDARFEELIGANFPGERTRRRPARFDAPMAPPPVRRDTDDDPPLTVLDAMDRADAADDEGWRPPPARPLGRWPFLVAVGALALAASVVLGITGLVVELPRSLGLVAAVLFVGGLALLLSQALRRRGTPPGDDGAVV